MSLIDTGPAGSTGSGLSERWFGTRLVVPAARLHLERVLDTMFGVGHLDPPRLADPAGPFAGARRPDFGASVITGRDERPGRVIRAARAAWSGRVARTPLGHEPDALIEVRLYAEPDRSTVYLGVAALCCQHPDRWEGRLLAAFERCWQASGDVSLYPTRHPGYGI